MELVSKVFLENIDEITSKEVDRLIDEVASKATNIEELNKAMWELGKEPKDATTFERMVHELVYRKFSERVRDLIKQVEAKVLKEALPR